MITSLVNLKIIADTLINKIDEMNAKEHNLLRKLVMGVWGFSVIYIPFASFIVFDNKTDQLLAMDRKVGKAVVSTKYDLRTEIRAGRVEDSHIQNNVAEVNKNVLSIKDDLKSIKSDTSFIKKKGISAVNSMEKLKHQKF
jgi:hypothetical protein